MGVDFSAIHVPEVGDDFTDGDHRFYGYLYASLQNWFGMSDDDFDAVMEDDARHRDSFHLSYGGFMRARRTIAGLIGLNLDEMWGYQDSYSLTELVKPRQWSTLLPSQAPLEPLLNHSDCEGWLTVSEVKGMKDTLEQITGFIPPDDGAAGLAVFLIKAADESCMVSFH